MHASRLLKLFGILSKKEFRQFKKYIHSPFFNTNAQLIQLFEYINQYYPNLKSRMLSKEHAFRHLFPEIKGFQAKKITNLMSELSLMVEDFLVQIEFTNNRIEQKKIRAEALGKRNLTSSLQKTFHLLDKDLNNASTKDLPYYLSQFQKNHKLCFDKATQNQWSIPEKEALTNAMNDLDAFYFLAKLQLSIEMKSRERHLGEEYSIKFLDEIITLSSTSLSEFSPLLKIYYHLNQLTSSGKELHFFEAKDIYTNHWSSIGINDQWYILLCLFNYSIPLANQGNLLFITELFSLYKFGLENEILLLNGELPATSFYNIVLYGIKLNEYDWLENFIAKYSNFLDFEIREQIKVLCLAIIHYSKEEYTKTRHILISHSFPKSRYKIRAKSLLLRAIYEELANDESQFSLFVSQSQSFERFLRRKKQLTEKYKYINFVQILRQLAKNRYNNSVSHKLISKMKNRISNSPSLANKPWILEKIEEL